MELYDGKNSVLKNSRFLMINHKNLMNKFQISQSQSWQKKGQIRRRRKKKSFPKKWNEANFNWDFIGFHSFILAWSEAKSSKESKKYTEQNVNVSLECGGWMKKMFWKITWNLKFSIRRRNKLMKHHLSILFSQLFLSSNVMKNFSEIKVEKALNRFII